MTDIVERLVGWVYTQRLQDTAEEAREEIDRLRHEVQRLGNNLRYERARTELIESESDARMDRIESLRGDLATARERIEQLEAKCSVIAGIASVGAANGSHVV
jgi:predicted RNase H-like nuclease (RuvC/YqgF family)